MDDYQFTSSKSEGLDEEFMNWWKDAFNALTWQSVCTSECPAIYNHHWDALQFLGGMVAVKPTDSLALLDSTIYPSTDDGTHHLLAPVQMTRAPLLRVFLVICWPVALVLNFSYFWCFSSGMECRDIEWTLPPNAVLNGFPNLFPLQ